MQLKFLPWKYIQSSLPRPNTYLFVHSHITYHNQGICIKNMVRNGRKIFEIPALLFIPNPNEELQSGKFKKVYIVSTDANPLNATHPFTWKGCNFWVVAIWRKYEILKKFFIVNEYIDIVKKNVKMHLIFHFSSQFLIKFWLDLPLSS